MAVFQNDPFPGTDYSQFLSWQKVVTPNGQVFYVVPGNEAYVYDPVASNATGRKVFRANPSAAMSEAEEEKRRQEELIKQQQFNQSPLGQLLPIGAGTAGLIAASHLAAPSAAAPLVVPGALGTAAGTAAATGALGTGAAIAPAAPAVLGVAPAATTVAPAATGLASGFGIGLGPLAGVAAATYLGGRSAYDMLRGKEDKSIPGLIGRGTLGIATGGLSEIARPLLGHKSTRDVAREHTADLLDVGKDDANYQRYVEGMRAQHDSAPIDPSKPFAGKYGSWDEYVKGGLEAGDLTGVYGNIKTYGPEWANLTQEQRQAITQANIDSGIYTSKKGEVEITDPVKALENKERVLKGFAVVTPGQAAAMGAMGSR